MVRVGIVGWRGMVGSVLVQRMREERDFDHVEPLFFSTSQAGGKGLYEPIHGTAPDIAGKGVANPLATILSAAMMLRYSLGQPQAADRIERAVSRVLASGLRTADIHTDGSRRVGTQEMGDAVLAAL